MHGLLFGVKLLMFLLAAFVPPDIPPFTIFFPEWLCNFSHNLNQTLTAISVSCLLCGRYTKAAPIYKTGALPLSYVGKMPKYLILIHLKGLYTRLQGSIYAKKTHHAKAKP
jgi:hypothetical protein